MEMTWEQLYANRMSRITGSAIRELLKLTEMPGVISFAGGLPAPDVFPIPEFAAATDQVLREEGARALQYGATEGYLPLREMIARHTARFGLQVTPENILITSGSQQALDLLGKIFINPGDRIVVESPTYLGALQAWNAYQAEYVPVPMDDEGMQVDALENALQTPVKFIYVLPNFQNPTGVTLSHERRQRLVALAERLGVPIVEDDPYGQLRYEGAHLPALVTLDGKLKADASYRGNVIYLSTFSKTLAPGIRLGWVIAPAPVIRKLVLAKQGTDLHTATFNQLVAYHVARGGFLDEHIRFIRHVYRERRDAMLAAIAEHFPPNVQTTRPQGGLFLWGTLPPGEDASDILRLALKSQVAFVPGAPFHPGGGGENTLRLNFSNASVEKIMEGIARLGRVLETRHTQAWSGLSLHPSQPMAQPDFSPAASHPAFDSLAHKTDR